MSDVTRAGLVAIVGLPNTGKSSLLNAFLGSKLSIVTAAAQTTREQVVGIDTRDSVQMVFIDTPGIVDPAYLLHRAMLASIEEALADADVVVLLLDGTRPPPQFREEIDRALRKLGDRLLPTINKVDVANPANVQSLKRWVTDRFGRAPLAISAATRDGVDALRDEIAQKLPVSPFLYPEDDLSSQSVRFFVTELIRETIFEKYEQEIPYSVAVRVEEFREEREPLYVRAVIYVERASQKAILIGQGGRSIRDLGTAARQKLEEFVGCPVYLDLWIKVLPKWRKDPTELRRFGFRVPNETEENARSQAARDPRLP